MTGFYVRINRGGNWDFVEFDQLTDAEMEAWFDEHPDDARKWAINLAKWIRENVKDVPFPRVDVRRTQAG